jgi:hypothetical protein
MTSVDFAFWQSCNFIGGEREYVAERNKIAGAIEFD